MSNYRKRVKLKETSRFANVTDPCNQPNAEGHIVGFDKDDPELYLHVLWDSGITNWYSLEDLEEIQ